MTSMKRAFRDLWLKKCTDGSYSTIVGELRGEEPNQRCCLGVAIAVGEELGMLEPGRLDLYRDDELLTEDEAAAIGLYEKQNDFANANDGHIVPEGKFYPDEVIEMITNFPVVD